MKNLSSSFQNKLFKYKLPAEYNKTGTIKVTLQGISSPDVDILLSSLHSSLDPLYPYPHLLNLYLSSNRITNVSLIAKSPSCKSTLVKLSLADNLIEDFSQVHLLATNLPSLQHLVLSGNPIAISNPTLYKSKTITAFRGSLLTLDTNNVTSPKTIDTAIRITLFEDTTHGQNLVKLSFHLYSLDRAASALKIKNELLTLNGTHTFNSAAEEEEDEDSNTTDTTVAKLIKIWNTSPNTTGLELQSVTKTLHSRLQTIIKKTRQNLRNSPSPSSSLSPPPSSSSSSSFDQSCADWDAAFKMLSLPLQNECKLLEAECKVCTGESSQDSMDDSEYNLLEQTALSYYLDDDAHCESPLSSPPKPIVQQSMAMALLDQGGGGPPTPTPSILSNRTIPELDDSDYEKQIIKETYTQVLKRMEKGTLDKGDMGDRGGKGKLNASILSHKTSDLNLNLSKESWRPPTKFVKIGSPPRGGVFDESVIVDGVQNSSPIKGINHHHHHHHHRNDTAYLSNSDSDSDSNSGSSSIDSILALSTINWETVSPDKVIHYTSSAPTKPNLTLPIAPTLSPPSRINMPHPIHIEKLQYPGETMKLLYSQVDDLFELMCDNHDTHLILFQINSGPRKCAESFSSARSKYLFALQQKFAEVVTTGRKWKKEVS